jgi:hypothetical protein
LPEHNETGREHVYYDSDHQVSTNTLADLGFSGTSPAVELDVDDTDGSGPETISLRAIPIKAIDFATTYGTEPDTQNGLPGTTTQYDYAWVGTAAFYVHGYSAALTEAGQVSTAQVEVFVFQGDTMLGLFTVPDFTQVNAIQLFRINFLLQDDGTTVYDFFQLVPEQAIFTDALPQTHVGPDGTVLLRSLEDETPVLNLRGAAH